MELNRVRDRLNKYKYNIYNIYIYIIDRRSFVFYARKWLERNFPRDREGGTILKHDHRPEPARGLLLRRE